MTNTDNSNMLVMTQSVNVSNFFSHIVHVIFELFHANRRFFQSSCSSLTNPRRSFDHRISIPFDYSFERRCVPREFYFYGGISLGNVGQS